MKRFLLKSSLYLGIFVLIVNMIGWVGDISLRKSKLFKPSFLLNNYDNQQRFDYFLLGSSRGLTTIDTKQVDDSLGTNGVNLSMDDTDLKTHLLMLKHFFANGYKSNYCILTLDHQSFTKTQQKLGDNDYRFAHFISQNHVREHFDEYETTSLTPIKNSAYLPFLKYSYYNLQLVPSALLATVRPNKRHRYDEAGNYTYPKKGIPKKEKITFEEKVVKITNPLVKEAMQICERNNTELIIYVAPYKGKSLKIVDPNTYVINQSSSIQESHLFYDFLHVNSDGRVVATDFFIQDFKKIVNHSTGNR
ncbi:MAG: hypothetical protein GY827_12075 [Cytophagales bacterium]|nr:hypothetical protein [Cytophagales bacterium]